MKLSPKRHLPSVANMEAFLSVARAGSMTAAAEELFITQGAVSKQVLELEKHVGTSLFTRTAQGLVLTPAGTALFERLSPLIAELEAAFTQARPSRSVLNVSAPPTFGTEIITPHLGAFQERNPGLLVNAFSRVGEVDLEREGLDAAIVAGEPRAGAYKVERLFIPTLYPYVSPALLHASATGESMLLHCKLIGLVTEQSAWERYFAQLGLPFSAQMVGTNHSLLTMTAQAVMSGYGVALLPEYVAGRQVAAGRMVRISDVPYRGAKPYFLVSRRTVADSDGFLRFRQWLLDLLERIGCLAEERAEH